MRILLNLSFLIIFLLSCKKKNDFSNVKIIGHAGNGLENIYSAYHDNTKEAIDLALSYSGCDGIEVDVQLSFEGTLWLYHDVDLSAQTSGQGCIPINSDKILENLNYKGLNKEKLTKLNHISKYNLESKEIFLDLRHYNNCEKKLINLEKMFQKIEQFTNIYEKTKINVITNYYDWLDELNNYNVNIFYSKENENISTLLDNSYIDGIIFKNKEVNKSTITQCKSSGKKSAIYEVRSPSMIKEAFKKLPDYLLTDDIKSSILEKY